MTDDKTSRLARMARESLRRQELNEAGRFDAAQLLLERNERLTLAGPETEAREAQTERSGGWESLLDLLDSEIARRAGEERYIP